MAIATFGPEPTKVTKKAAADLSALRYRLMKYSAADTVNKATAASDTPCGILTNKPDAAGKEAVVWLIADGGQCLLEVDGTTPIAVGDNLTSDSVGRGIKTTTDNEVISARALEASSAAGDVIAVEVFAAHRY